MEYLATIRDWLKTASTLVIHAGAGMSADSGLATYRNEGGLWGDVEQDMNKSVFEVITPQAFEESPLQIWTLFAKRIKTCEETQPHAGYRILLDWIQRYQLDYFILTSNVDGHFQKAGFEERRIRELHGSLQYFQGTQPEVSKMIWKNQILGDKLLIDLQKGIFPTCPNDTIMARPNVYMFRDHSYVNTRSESQKNLFQTFLSRNKGQKMVVIEIGSGPHVQSIRAKTRMLRTQYGASIIRINPKDFSVKPPHIGIPLNALQALTEINQYLLDNE